MIHYSTIIAAVIMLIGIYVFFRSRHGVVLLAAFAVFGWSVIIIIETLVHFSDF